MDKAWRSLDEIGVMFAGQTQCDYGRIAQIADPTAIASPLPYLPRALSIIRARPRDGFGSFAPEGDIRQGGAQRPNQGV